MNRVTQIPVQPTTELDCIDDRWAMLTRYWVGPCGKLPVVQQPSHAKATTLTKPYTTLAPLWSQQSLVQVCQTLVHDHVQHQWPGTTYWLHLAPSPYGWSRHLPSTALQTAEGQQLLPHSANRTAYYSTHHRNTGHYSSTAACGYGHHLPSSNQSTSWKGTSSPQVR